MNCTGMKWHDGTDYNDYPTLHITLGFGSTGSSFHFNINFIWENTTESLISAHFPG